MSDDSSALPPVYLTTLSAGTNIACIKYWGKADAHYNTPINSSVSVTLDQQDLRAVTTVAASVQFPRDRLWLNGSEEEGAAHSGRFRACVDGVKALASDRTMEDGTVVSRQDWQKMHVHVSSYNTFPTAAGLASSAAGYAALVASLADLMGAVEEYDGQLSTIARQGSGSACRSLYGGFVAWRQGNGPEWLDSKAEQIAPETDWPEIRALILVVSDAKKDTSSTAGMSTSVETSELLKYRAETVVPKRMEMIEEAWKSKDFDAFGKLTMQDSNQFHATCLDTYPPIFYMNDISRSVIHTVTAFNAFYETIRAAYTFDAGPNAVIYCLEENATEIAALMLHYYPAAAAAAEHYMNNAELAKAATEYTLNPELVSYCDKTGRVPAAGDVKMMYYTKAGPGPLKVTDVCNLDPVTGLNTYQKE
jgi:diphosphomevalonate decarboxylase